MNDAIWNGLQQIRDRWIAEADEASVSEQFRRERDRTARFRRAGIRLAVAACLIAVACAVPWMGNRANPADARPAMEASVMQAASVAEMEKYLGYRVPLVSRKTVAELKLYAAGAYAQTGEVTYTDGSSFRISRGEGGVSEIAGASLERTEILEEIPVSFYTAGDRRYVLWSCNGYFCGYFDYDANNVILTTEGTKPDHSGEIGELITFLRQ